jgi:CRP/FNR family transcriptional regulator, cyclic AMP receptor protein
MTNKQKDQTAHWETFLAGISQGESILEYSANRVIFWQGEAADSVFYLRKGKVKISVTAQQGKEPIIALLGEVEFFGEGCPGMSTIAHRHGTAMTDCTLARIEKPRMSRALHEQHDFSELFVTHLLSRNIRYQRDDCSQSQSG